MDDYIIEMLGITKEFPGIIANDNITLQLRKGEIHALLGENGAGKSTLMSVLFGLYQPEKGIIKVRGREVKIKGPLDANALGIGMVHQHFKLVHNFTVLQNIVLGMETVSHGFLKMDNARKKVVELSERYGLYIDPDALIQDITVGMQQRGEILKMLYRDNEIMIFDEPTAVLTPQEIDELMEIMRSLVAEGKSILFITHKLDEIKAVADRCSVLRRGKYIGTVDVASITKEEMSEMMVGRKVSLSVEKTPAAPGRTVLEAEHVSVKSHMEGHTKLVVNDVSFQVRSGEIVCIAGIDGNGQTELVHAVTGLGETAGGRILINGRDVTKKSIRARNTGGLSHIPEDRHKHGPVRRGVRAEAPLASAVHIARGAGAEHLDAEPVGDQHVVEGSVCKAEAQAYRHVLVGHREIVVIDAVLVIRDVALHGRAGGGGDFRVFGDKALRSADVEIDIVSEGAGLAVQLDAAEAGVAAYIDLVLCGLGAGLGRGGKGRAGEQRGGKQEADKPLGHVGSPQYVCSGAKITCFAE